MPLGELGFRVARRRPHAVVKLHDVPAAILPFRNVPLEASVVHGMVFHLHGHSLDLGVVTGPLGNGPALEGVSYLETEVVMAPAGVVQLDHKDRPLPLRQRFARLRLLCLIEAPLAAVFAEGHALPRATCPSACALRPR